MKKVFYLCDNEGHICTKMLNTNINDFFNLCKNFNVLFLHSFCHKCMPTNIKMYFNLKGLIVSYSDECHKIIINDLSILACYLRKIINEQDLIYLYNDIIIRQCYEQATENDFIYLIGRERDVKHLVGYLNKNNKDKLIYKQHIDNGGF